MSHDHSHDHKHTAHDHHEHGDNRSGGKLLASILITTLTLVAEVVGGILTGSLALLSDAAHVFMDIFALALSYGAVRLAQRAPSARHSFGFRRMKVLAAFINGTTLLVVAIEIFREAYNRFFNSEHILAGPMLIIAGIGLGANLLVALVLGGHDHDDLNARAAFLHVLGDALSSVGVIAAGLIILFTGWYWVDTVASVLIGIVILTGAWRVLKETIHILNEGAPEGSSAESVEHELKGIPGIISAHDVHVWTIEPGYTVLSAHVVLEDQLVSKTAEVLERIKNTLDSVFGIRHVTIQFECGNCGQACVVCEDSAH
ncbi:cation diffusion facilitator family transporter [Gracilinema caldarium]|uniref:cation diffusion facilitator family transporter n=1 Tax=Gracilinema caldarium TaxID=215591 RepID=UPI0026EF29D4|nr:cation diffusion facilitator family transporter [Gracilinema caldarium]